MAKQPESNEDPAKKSDDAGTPVPKSPKPVVPNMSLDDPTEVPLDAEEVFDAEVMEAALAPASDVAAFVLSDDDVIFDDEVEVVPPSETEPLSDIVVAEAEAEDAAPIETTPASEVLEVEEFIEEVDPIVEEAALADEVVEVSGSSAVVAEPALMAESNRGAPFGAPLPAEPIVEVSLEEAIAEEIERAAPASGPMPTDDAFPGEISHEEAASAPDLLAADEADLAPPASEILAAEEPVVEVAEAPPASDLLVVDEVADATPASAVLAAEEVVEVAPASDVLAAEEYEDAVEDASALEVDEVLADEEPIEAEAASEAKSGELVEEFVEAAEEVSSATRKAEAVLDDEAVVAGPISATEEAEPVETGSSAVLFDDMPTSGSSARKPGRSGADRTADFDRTVAFDAPPSSDAHKADDDRLVTEEDLGGSSEASAVDLGEMPRKGSSVTGIDKVAEALESGTDLGGDDAGKSAPSVEFDELLDDAGDDSDAELAAAEAVDDEGSTELDADVVEEDFDTVKGVADAKKKDKQKGKKDKKKAAPKSTGDDIDLDAIFDEEIAESAEAEEAEAFEDEAVAEAAEDEVAEAEDAEEAEEAAEAFDEELAAAEDAEEAEATDDDELADFDDDEKPVKGKDKGKKGAKAHQADEDEEDDEDLGAKTKGKKEKTKLAPPPKQPSMALRWLGGMFVATLLLVGGLAAGMFFAPDDVKKAVDTVSGKEPPAPPPPLKIVEKKPAQKAREAMDEGKYQDAIAELQTATEPAELSARGEAKWLGYYKAQAEKKAALDKDDPAVKGALKDLADAKNDLMVAQINAALKEKDLTDQLDTAMKEKGKVEKELTLAQAGKLNADKLVDSVADVLVTGKLIEDKTKFDVAMLDKIVKGLNEDRAVLDKVNKILEGEVKGKGEDGLKEVLKLKKQADDTVLAVDKALEGADVKEKGAKGVQTIATARNAFEKDRDDVVKTLADAFKNLVDGKIVPADADPRKEIVAGTKMARVRAESPLSIPLAQIGLSLGGIGSGTSKVVEEALAMAKTGTELNWFRVREEFIQTPQKKMDTYLQLLQDRSHNAPKALAAIEREVDWVLEPASKSGAEARAKALYVRGLAFRNEQKFPEATAAFAGALKANQALPKPGAWSEMVVVSHKELTDPTFYYLPRMELLLAKGDVKGALDEANVALKAMPNEGRLYAQRGLIRLESVRGKGPRIALQVQKAIQDDAKAARNDKKLKGEAAFIDGLLAEEMGNWLAAETLYRQAIQFNEDNNGMADEAGKYRVALGRLLLRDRTEGEPAAPPAPAEKQKLGAIQPESTNPVTIVHPWSLLIVTATIAQVPTDELEDKETIARLKEVMNEAEKLKLSKNTKLQGQGYCLMGSALSKLGKRSEGLKEFAKGLQLIYPSIEAKEINELIADHPAFQQPDTSNVPNPIMAERHFGEGMHLYWSKQYEDAEKQFLQAVKYYDKDARYQYYLGLAQLPQKTRAKRDAAIYAFEQGARLEAKAVGTNPYATREINQSLERIQGELRQLLNHYRYRPATEPEPDTKPRKDL